jgi:hypothetical protein
MQAAWDNVFSAYESGPQFELHQNQSNGKKNSEFSHQYAHAREELPQNDAKPLVAHPSLNNKWPGLS